MLSRKLLGCRRHFGIAVVYFFSETWGNWFKQRGIFPPRHPTGFGTLCLKPLAPGESRTQSAARSVSQRSWAQWSRATGHASQQTPCGRWKPASYGFALWLVGEGRRLEPGASLTDILPGGGEAPVTIRQSPTSPVPLSLCSYGLALRTGSNTPYQVVLASLARNVLDFFFFFLLQRSPDFTSSCSWDIPGKGMPIAHQLHHQAGDPFARSVGWFGFEGRKKTAEMIISLLCVMFSEQKRI